MQLAALGTVHVPVIAPADDGTHFAGAMQPGLPAARLQAPVSLTRETQVPASASTPASLVGRWQRPSWQLT